METGINLVRQCFGEYKVWVAQNPQIISDVETTAKWVSYFIAGRISKSSITTELIYSLSNLLIMFNDKIIKQAQETSDVDTSAYRIKVILTTLEYCEVLLEISMRKMFGEKIRWIIIVAVQTIKTIGRYLLLCKYSESIIRSPPITQLNRKLIKQEKQTDIGLKAVNNDTIKLGRSGRVMRKVEGAPPFQYRHGKLLENDETPKENALVLSIAESIYIAKPLLHLLSMRMFGRKSWKSYSLALVMDIMSIRTYYKNQHLMTKEQQVELSRRTCSLLMFWLRSPFYDSVSKQKIEGFIEAFGNRIPFAKAICDPLKEYIPQWQDTYFYTWST